MVLASAATPAQQADGQEAHAKDDDQPYDHESNDRACVTSPLRVNY